jgi:predicted GNAT superfamily acetyltransferase
LIQNFNADILAVVVVLSKEGCIMAEDSLQTPEQAAAALAGWARNHRLARNWKQVTLARRSGVSLSSLQRFEETGRVSLQNLLKIAFALDRLGDFDSLLQQPVASSLGELEAGQQVVRRQRGRK